jgi:CBS domain containing-hemolysin-like protein
MSSYILIGFLIICSAFFSSSEIAFASVNKLRLKNTVKSGKARHKWALEISENYGRALCTILIGNNLVNIAASSAATVIAIEAVGNTAIAYATAVMTLIILTFGEIIPKQLATRYSYHFVIIVSPILRMLMIITKPIVYVFMLFVSLVSRLWGGAQKESALSDDELVTIIETVEEEGLIDGEQSELLQSVIEFDDIEALEIITHRRDMLAIDINKTADEFVETVISSPFSRIPVYDGNIDNIIGIISVNTLLKSLVDTKTPDICSMITDVCFVHQSKKLPIVLEEMQRNKIHMVVVIDDYGGTMGILTLEDILEQLVGDIWDETDEIQQKIKKLSEHEFEVDGSMNIHDFFEYIGMNNEYFREQSNTMNGWVIEVLKDFPKAGESFMYKNMNVTVAEMDELRIKKLNIRITLT